MSNKNKLFIILGIMVIIAVSFITSLLISQGKIFQFNKSNNSIPLQIEIREALRHKSESEIKKYTLNQEEMYVFFNIINNLTYSSPTCDGLPTHIISYNSNDKKNLVTYSLEAYNTEYHILGGIGEAKLSNEQKEQLEKILNKLYN